MAEPPSKRARTTPSKSSSNEAAANNEAASTNATPREDLRALANVLNQQQTRTPLRAASAGPSHTPSTAAPQPARTPRAINARQFPVARRVGAPTTPHAIRALQARRDAALAASGGRKNRRRSIVQQQETPRDILRALSRRLAPISQRIIPSPDYQQMTTRRRPEGDDLDEGPDLPRPRLSMPINEDEDDSFHEAPPRLSLALEDMDTTAHSLEGGRRAVSEDPRPRLSMARLRLSERFGDDMDVLSEEGGAEMYDGTIGPLVFDGEPDDVLGEEITTRFEDDTTQELRAMLASRRRSRVSDIDQPAGADLDDEPTFRFKMPGSRDPSLLFPQQEEEEDEQEAADDEGVAEDEDAVDEEDAEDAVEGAADALPAAGEEDEEDYETEPDADQDVEIEEDEQALESQLRQGSIPRSASPSSRPKKQTTARRKSLKVSRYGTPYPSLPSSVTKRLATSFARLHSGPTTKLSKDTLDAISQASDWFFEQIGEDLASYAEHAGRKTIEEADVLTLMNRQRQVNASTTPFSLAQKYLPRELLQEIRMPQATLKSKRSTARKRNRMEMETIDEEAEE
ncbi:hypothetical protein BFW01_g3515 [Lasiodiplodia theobromae]|uniref:CENP-T/Histone H4 histone fold domain-containing protein n=1 Tax=Lasiodiplodia theobromae TaxID=45133 RepID=A0A5N5DSW8_9PEZI|nr:Histone-fold domain containing protein [Lasiodiplodia theobromae]KAB2580471.1 Uncharacterized protein DBV05_g1032 [Lasiodiplodia theobromae]KAF4541384.1 Histone-fold domain containing protein [Lasiodiplodia theobromae]KAF9632652.1 hypothetical protein BFW01_g3515 [Lasiodiplodia theobromae]